MYEKRELVAMKVEELKGVLRTMDLPVSGKKAELVERIISNQLKGVTNSELTGKGDEEKVSNEKVTNVSDGEKVTSTVVTSDSASDWELKRLMEENARLKAQLGKRGGGKPAIGETRKVSLTLTVEDWQYVDSESKAFGSKSAYLRYAIEDFINRTR